MIRQGNHYLTYFRSRFLVVVFDDEVPSFTPFSDQFVFLLVLVIEGSFGNFGRISLGTQSASPPFFHLLLGYRTGLVVAVDDNVFRAGDFARLSHPLGFMAATGQRQSSRYCDRVNTAAKGEARDGKTI